MILREIFDLASDEEFNIIDRNIKYRYVHKIRKTVCSTLIDSGININTVREIMGHSDEETTLRNYTFDTNEASDTDKAVIKALSI
ncbi:tyrosine-type recombinase/integrase [uncultured Eubacterium sp.]|uniref:tyrosine-type recombinase/integrase n=1 Tax=uncultured Eubacterium sp. TaxID=165185 RepID=UPI0026DD0ACE|nr:tyrosine-type recombinase/integrase [uncultured Eubacterium sp.]